MSAEAIVASTIAEALSQAETLSDQAKDYAADAVTAANGAITFPVIDDLVVPTITIADYTPEEMFGDDFLSDYDANLAALKAEFTPLFASLYDTYFDDEIVGVSDAWVKDVIENGTLGVSPAVENSLWQRMRDRENESSQVLESQAYDDFASRGFSIPGGALANRLALIRVESQKKIAEANRSVSVDLMKERIQNIQFAVDRAIQLRSEMQKLVLGYLDQYMKLGELAGFRAKTRGDLNASLWQAASSYYNTLVNVEKLKLEVNEANMRKKLELNRLDANVWVGSVENRVKAAIAAADSLGKVAAAYAGAQNTNASISNNTQETA